MLSPSSSYASSARPATAANCRPQPLPSPPISSASCGFSTHCYHCRNLPFLLSCRSSRTSPLPSPSAASSSVGHLCSSLPSVDVQPLSAAAIFPRSHNRPPLQHLHLASSAVAVAATSSSAAPSSATEATSVPLLRSSQHHYLLSCRCCPCCRSRFQMRPCLAVLHNRCRQPVFSIGSNISCNPRRPPTTRLFQSRQLPLQQPLLLPYDANSYS
ncbi:hypothetical protein B296_00050097 [Ensete ventricosum]|uniref:Uncharacterized protein n=1 Tax=Ensete ventricosum TaxID=4639 RepID=A0A426XXR7_ENSVE|nr:hypothetical protein B296_00050097 [Ensete ventricosum]